MRPVSHNDRLLDVTEIYWVVFLKLCLYLEKIWNPLRYLPERR